MQAIVSSGLLWKTEEECEEFERLEVRVWIEMRLKSQLIERNFELQQLGKMKEGL